jgi:hypothetical protein|tara:strand:- start:340 stop:618 length:279 start_codon:yes stop_codon:yes gene_type:complete
MSAFSPKRGLFLSLLPVYKPSLDLPDFSNIAPTTKNPAPPADAFAPHVSSSTGLQPTDLYGKFTWKIENFSEISKRELRSNVFEVGSYKWCA